MSLFIEEEKNKSEANPLTLPAFFQCGCFPKKLSLLLQPYVGLQRLGSTWHGTSTLENRQQIKFSVIMTCNSIHNLSEGSFVHCSKIALSKLCPESHVFSVNLPCVIVFFLSFSFCFSNGEHYRSN